MADREKKRGKWKYINLNNSRTKRAFSMKYKAFFMGYHLVNQKQWTQALTWYDKTNSHAGQTLAFECSGTLTLKLSPQF